MLTNIMHINKSLLRSSVILSVQRGHKTKLFRIAAFRRKLRFWGLKEMIVSFYLQCVLFTTKHICVKTYIIKNVLKIYSDSLNVPLPILSVCFNYKAESSHKAVFPFSAASHLRMQFLLTRAIYKFTKDKSEILRAIITSQPIVSSFPERPFPTPEALVYAPPFYQIKEGQNNPFLVG